MPTPATTAKWTVAIIASVHRGGELADVGLAAATVEIFHQEERVASHRRAARKGEVSDHARWEE